VFTPKAPRAVGPYSQAVLAGNMLFISGQLPFVPITGELISGDFQRAAEQVIKNISAILQEAGMELSNIVQTRVYLKKLKNFEVFNDIYSRYFQEPYPARAVIEISDLPKNADLEIEAVACKYE
ncbi:MAG TPA: hypothetical protein DC049_09425, partial [Spirochaetia bacterium]|nr:hypothetical protein [Spirochaetia bacterium]